MFEGPRQRRGRVSITVGGLVLVAGLVLAACGGGGSDTGVASASGSGKSASGSGSSRRGRLTEKDALKFSQCMRSHGVTNFPDPTVDSNGDVRVGRGNGNGSGSGGQPAFDTQSQTFRDARQACRKYLPTFNLSPSQQTTFRDAALKFAKCMRKQGINVPDPNFSNAPGQGGGGGGGGGGFRGIFGNPNINRNDPKVAAAIKKCQSAFTAVRNARRGGNP